NETETESNETETESNETETSDKLTVGFVYVGPVGDGGWSYAHDQGRKYLEEKLDVETLYVESVSDQDASIESEIRNMVDQGAKVIFATSYGYMNYVEKMSKEYPEVKFFHCSGYKTTDNMANYFGRIYQPRYLSGIVAGMKTESNKIGYVAAFPIPEVIRGINAFTLGAKSVNPDVTVEVNWTSTWYNPGKEKESAVALLDKGIDVIAQHQDTAGPQQAAEEYDAFSIGYNTSMKEMAPDAYMTAPVWNWGPYYVDQVKNVMNNEFESHSYWKGLGDNIVELDELTELAPEGSREKVQMAKEAIVNGDFEVFQGPIKDQDGNIKIEKGESLSDKEMLEMEWFVEGVKGSIEE
ncbi:MAG: BMP family ABC transporter substrate-binding protein, partial [Bacillota bacterium]